MEDAWRLIVDDAVDGYTNMAVDEAIMQAHAAGLAPPTLRFFRWKPACVSLGYFQSALAEVDMEACREEGVDCVRRPTGGRAILHDAELTYSVVAREEHPAVAGSIPESYRKISVALLRGLRELGIAAEMKPLGRQTPPEGPASGAPWLEGNSPAPPGAGTRALTAACFDVPSDYEIAVAGRKLVGSAQTRRDGVILQHGSVLIEVDPGQIFKVLRPPAGATREEVARWLAARVTSLQAELGREVSVEEVAGVLCRSFSAVFEVTLQPGALSDYERGLAERLRAEKYGTPEWNLKR